MDSKSNKKDASEQVSPFEQPSNEEQSCLTSEVKSDTVCSSNSAPSLSSSHSSSNSSPDVAANALGNRVELARGSQEPSPPVFAYRAKRDTVEASSPPFSADDRSHSQAESSSKDDGTDDTSTCISNNHSSNNCDSSVHQPSNDAATLDDSNENHNTAVDPASSEEDSNDVDPDLEEEKAKVDSLKAEEGSSDTGIIHRQRSRKRSRFSSAPLGSKLKRPRRWGEATNVIGNGGPTITPALSPESLELRRQIEEVQSRIQNPLLAIMGVPLADRSPSPPPVYDRNGNRTNTREWRMREKLKKQRDNLITLLLKCDDSFKPPSDYCRPKLTHKVYLPSEEYPDCDFAGKIIGTRGSNHQRLQRDTGCRITVKGLEASEALAKVNGNLEEWFDACEAVAQGRQPLNDSELEPLHVEIVADNEEKLNKGIEMVREIIKSAIEGTLNMEGSRALMLASRYGAANSMGATDSRGQPIGCRICGGFGHPLYRCPQRNSDWTAANVECEICGEVSHVTVDCKHFDRSRPLSVVIAEFRSQHASTAAVGIDKEYELFMEDLTGVSLGTGRLRALTGPTSAGNGSVKSSSNVNRTIAQPMGATAAASSSSSMTAAKAVGHAPTVSSVSHSHSSLSSVSSSMSDSSVNGGGGHSGSHVINAARMNRNVIQPGHSAHRMAVNPRPMVPPSMGFAGGNPPMISTRPHPMAAPTMIPSPMGMANPMMYHAHNPYAMGVIPQQMGMSMWPGGMYSMPPPVANYYPNPSHLFGADAPDVPPPPPPPPPKKA